MKHPRGEPLAPTQTAVRHIAREAGRPGPIPAWELVTVTFVALLIIAAIAVLVVGIPQ